MKYVLLLFTFLITSACLDDSISEKDSRFGAFADKSHFEMLALTSLHSFRLVEFVDIAEDKNDNIYYLGNFKEEGINLGLGNATPMLSELSGTKALFITKFNRREGTWWTKFIKSDDEVHGRGLHISEVSGDVFVFVEFRGIVNFQLNPDDPDIYKMSAINQFDPFLMKINADDGFAEGVAGDLSVEGTNSWVYTFTSSMPNIINDVVYVKDDDGDPDDDSLIYFTGKFAGINVNFDPLGSHLVSSNGSYDYYLTKIKPLDGTHLKTFSFGGDADEEGLQVEVDILKNVFTTSTSNTHTLFDNDPGISNNQVNVEAIYKESFLHKYTPADIVDKIIGLKATANYEAKKLLVDNASSVFIGGNLSGFYELNPADPIIINDPEFPAVTPVKSPEKLIENAFLVHFDNAGNYLNSHLLHTDDYSTVNDIMEYDYSIIEANTGNTIAKNELLITVNKIGNISTSNLSLKLGGVSDFALIQFDDIGLNVIGAQNFSTNKNASLAKTIIIEDNLQPEIVNIHSVGTYNAEFLGEDDSTSIESRGSSDAFNMILKIRDDPNQ